MLMIICQRSSEITEHAATALFDLVLDFSEHHTKTSAFK